MGIFVLVTLDQITQPPSKTLDMLITPSYGGESFTFGIKPDDRMCGEDLKQIIVSRRSV